MMARPPNGKAGFIDADEGKIALSIVMPVSIRR
jgi:hypothetical protein